MRVLVVEDNRTSLMILAHLVAQVPDCEAVPFADPLAALAHATEQDCDLILVDYLMPAMNGIEFIRAIRSRPGYGDVPIVMVTADSDRAVRQAAIEAGATDFTTKPIEPIELKVRLRNLAALRRAHIEQRSRAEWLQAEVAKATATIAEREHEMIIRLARAAEFRDGATGAHIERIAHYARMTAEALGLPDDITEQLFFAAPMHDIGKLAVPDAILSKPGPLTPDERAVMQRHTIHGHDILAGSSVPLLQCSARIALSHHECFDGSGYPHGLAGPAIPLECRIVSVVDVFDALTSPRVYKPAWPIEEARANLLDGSGNRFDADCVRAFLSRWPDITAFHAQHGDRTPLVH